MGAWSQECTISLLLIQEIHRADHRGAERECDQQAAVTNKHALAEQNSSVGRDLQTAPSPTTRPLQGWRASSKCLLNSDRHGASTTSPGSLFQCLTTLMGKKSFLTPSLTPPARLCAIPVCPVTGAQGAETGTSLCASPPQDAAESAEVTSRPPFSRPDSPGVLSLLTSHAFQTFYPLCCPPLPSTLVSFLYCGAQNCTQCSR